MLTILEQAAGIFRSAIGNEVDIVVRWYHRGLLIVLRYSILHSRVPSEQFCNRSRASRLTDLLSLVACSVVVGNLLMKTSKPRPFRGTR